MTCAPFAAPVSAAVMPLCNCKEFGVESFRTLHGKEPVQIRV